MGIIFLICFVFNAFDRAWIQEEGYIEFSVAIKSKAEFQDIFWTEKKILKFVGRATNLTKICFYLLPYPRW